MDSNIIGVVVADLRGQLLEANQAFLDMMGYSREELAGGAPPEWRILDERAIEQIDERGIATPWETEFVRRDGSRLPILVGAAQVDADGGQCICFILDQTERKRAEERLLKAYDELEVRVQERTAQLSQVNADLKNEIAERRLVERVLARRTRELARSNADLEQFASAAAHDLQEPLRTVTSYVQLLAKRYRGRLDPDADEFIEFAVDGVARMRALIHDLLAYSRVGTVGLRLEPTDCERVLERALANLQASIEESGAVVTHEPLPAVDADGAQLVQLFQNLIGNAIKFRGEQPLRVHVRAERDGSDWRFSFKDNSQGIDAKHLERIFVVFQRLHNREQYPGTGIGLAICRKIVERHGGRIGAESEPGRGSEFWFTLPMAAVERWVARGREATSTQDSANAA